MLLVWGLFVSGEELPFYGTVWIDSNVITPADPTCFTSLTYHGEGTRRVWDERFGRMWTNQNCHLFDLQFSDGTRLEAQLHTGDYSQRNAETEARRFGEIFGQMPSGFRWGLREFYVNNGNAGWSAGSQAVNINMGFTSQTHFFEEIILHEVAHTGLDPRYRRDSNWLGAQSRDGAFISEYARDYPTREDMAESSTVWFMSRYRSGRIGRSTLNNINSQIPARLSFFDSLRIDMFPVRAALSSQADNSTAASPSYQVYAPDPHYTRSEPDQVDYAYLAAALNRSHH